MATAGAQPKKSENTKQGANWWFAGYAGGSLFSSKPNLIADRWIYILERRDGVPVKLHLEVCADKDGKLSQVAGDLRRQQERRSPQLKMAPVDSVPLPTHIQAKLVRYFLFASPTRLTKRAIRALEFAMAKPSNDWLDLENLPPGRAYSHSGRPPVLLVVDPLTIAVALHSAYERVLDEELHYVMPSEKSTKAQDATIRARVLKYQLAQLIVHNMLPQRQDPLNVRKELADAMGDQVFKYVEDFDTGLEACKAQVDGAAAQLIEHFDSPHWGLLAQLHLYTREDTELWLDFSGTCLDRLSSCDRGIKYFGGVHDKPPAWLAPDGVVVKENKSSLAEKADGMVGFARRAAAGASTVWGEILPSAVVLGKISTQEALDRVDQAYRTAVKGTSEKAAVFQPSRTVSVSPAHGSDKVQQLDRHALKDDLFEIKEWSEDHEGRWPKETEAARTARTITNVLRLFEFFNLSMKMVALLKSDQEHRFETSCDVAGAVLDTLSAFEDALKPSLEKVASKAVAGASLKMFGVISSLIDVVLTVHKYGEAKQEGKRDLLAPYIAGIISGGIGTAGGLGHVGIALAGADGPLVISLGLAASALCFGALTAGIVINLYQEGKKENRHAAMHQPLRVWQER